MKFIYGFLSIFLMVSCTSTQKNVKSKLEQEKPRNISEIKKDSQSILDAHPELNDEAKKNLKLCIDRTLNEHQKLKDEESKIIQLLLRKSLMADKLTREELREKNILKKNLTQIYRKKSENFLELIKNISEMRRKDSINETVNDDIYLFLRDIR